MIILSLARCPSLNVSLTQLAVMYRSKDSILPDFSQESGPGGEVFFDVGFYHPT